MAVTGGALFGFVIAHLAGNLQIFLGPEKFNGYAHALHELEGPLWVARIILLISVGLHIWSTIQLAILKNEARPVRYVKWKASASTYASRTMYMSGPIVAAFVIYHLMQFTFGVGGTHYSPSDPYGNVIAGFRNPTDIDCLCDRDGAALSPSSPRAVERAADAGHLSSAVHTAHQGSRVADGAFHLLRLRVDSDGGTGGCDPANLLMQLDSRIPSGPIEKMWDKARFEMKLVNPANKRKYEIIVVGSGLAGGSAAATLAELGYNVKCFCFQDSPRRAHSIAAQGGINAAKNYQNDGDSIYRLFYDTVKGGDFRAREANVYRLAQISVNIIDQCVAQGVPFAREYGGTLANRSFGGAQVSRTFYARGQTGQQLLLGAYQALERQVDAGSVKMFPRTEMLDLVVIDGRARGIVTRDLVTGAIETPRGRRRGAGHRRLRQRVSISRPTRRDRTARPSGARTSAARRSRNPCFTQIHPTCIPVSGDYQSKLTLMSESLRNDGRIWVP